MKTTIGIMPTQDRIIVKPIAPEKQTAGGIIIPDSATEKPALGEVVAVGCGKIESGELTPICVGVGAKIYHARYGGTVIKVDDEEYLILREDDILAVIQ